MQNQEREDNREYDREENGRRGGRGGGRGGKGRRERDEEPTSSAPSKVVSLFDFLEEKIPEVKPKPGGDNRKYIQDKSCFFFI